MNGNSADSNNKEDGWIESIDPKSGRTFYANRYTRTTQWEAPPGWKSKSNYNNAASTNNNGGGGRNNSLSTENNNQQQPGLLSNSSSNSNNGHNNVTTMVEVDSQPLPEGWEEMVDPNSGRIFYIDHVNQITTWERPRIASDNFVTTSAAAAKTVRNDQQHSSSSLQQQTSQQQQYDQSNNNNDEDDYYNTASVMTLNQHGSHSHWDDNPRSGSRNNSHNHHHSQSMSSQHALSSTGPSSPPQLDFTVLTIPNPLRQSCPSCSNPFSYTRRKHHCRLCGDIFCDACSNNRSILPLEGDEYNVPVRVCDVCMRDVKRGNYFSLRRYLTCLELYIDVDDESDGRKKEDGSATEQQQLITLGMVAASLSSLLTDIEAMLLEPITSFSTKMTISANILVPAVARHLKRRKTGEYAVWVLATLLQLGSVVGDDSFALAMLGIVSEDVGGGGGNGDDDDGVVNGEEKLIKSESTSNIVLTADQQQQQQQSSKNYVKNILKILEWNGNDIRTLSAQEQAVKVIYYITDPDLIANTLSMKESLQEEDEGPVDVDAVADTMKKDELKEEVIHIDIHRAFRSMLDHAMSSASPSLQRWATACLSHLIAEDQRRACSVEHSSSSSSSTPKKKYESFTSQLVSTGGVMILCSLLNSDDGETRAHATSALEAIVIATREIGLALQPSFPKKGRGFSRVGRGTENDSAIVDAIISNVGGSSLPALAHLLISADESVSMMGCSFILSLISPLLTDPRGSGRALQQCSNSLTSSGVGLSFEMKEDGLSSYRNAAIALVVGDDTLQGDMSCLPSLIAIVRSGMEDTSSWNGGSKARPLKVRAKAAECLAAVALAVGHVIGMKSEQSSYDSTYMKAKSALEVMEHERIFEVALQIITSDSHRSLDPSRDTPESRLREAAGLILLALSSSSIVSCSYLMSNGAVSTLLTIASESRMLNTPSSVRGKWASKGLCFLEAATTLLIRAWKTEHENGATSSSSSQSLDLLIETINSGAVEMASRLVKTKVTLKSHDLAYSQLRVKIAICFMLSSIFGMANNENSDVGLSRLYSAIDADCAQFLATSGGEDIGVRADLVGATLNLLNATLPYAHQFTKEDADEPLPMIDLSEACLLAVGSMCGLADPIGSYSRIQRNDINNGGKYSHIRLDTCAIACNILIANQTALLPTVLVGVIGESLIVPTLRLVFAICLFGNNDVCSELSMSGMLVPVGDILQRALASSDYYTAMISVALIKFCGQCTFASNGASGTVETLKGAIHTLSSVLTLPETQNDTRLDRHRPMLKYESLVALGALNANDTLQSTMGTIAIPALVSFLQQLEISHSYAEEIENEDAVFVALVTIQKTISVPSNSSIQSMMNNGIISILGNIFEKREEVKNKRIQEVALQIIQSIAQSNMENRYWLTCSGLLRSILLMLGESRVTAGAVYVGLTTVGLFLSDLKPSVLTHLEPSKKGELLQQYLNAFCSQRDFVRRLIATISDDCKVFGHPFVCPEDSGPTRDTAADVLFHIFSLLLLHDQSSHFDDAIMLNDVSGNEMNVATACSALLDLFSDDETNSVRAPSNPQDRSYYSDLQLPTVKSHLIETISTSLNQALSSSSKTDAERLIKKLKLPRTCLVLCRSDKLAESAFRLFEEVVLSLPIDFVGNLILCDRVALVTLFDLVTGQANRVPNLEYSKQTFAKLLGNLAKAGLLPKAVKSFGVRSHSIAALSAAMVVNGEDENIDDDEDSIQRICLESLAMVLRDEEDQIKLSSVESRALASALGKMLSSTVLARFFTQANLEATINNANATVDFGLNRAAICQSAEARLLCAMAHFPESLDIVSRVGGLEAVGLIAHEGEIGAVEAVMGACKMNPQLVVDVEAHLSIMDALVGTEDKLSSSWTKTNVDVVVKCMEIVTTLSICDDTRDFILNADQSGYCMKIASNIVTANAKLKCGRNVGKETSSERGADLAARNLAEKLIATSIDDKDLQIGDPVLVDSTSSKSDSSPKKKDENHTHEELEGVIAFMGPVQFAPGDDWIGIHLTGSSIGKGRNDGSVKGEHYFDCEEKSGVFVKKTHVRKRVMDLNSSECDSVEISLPEPAQQPTNPWQTMLMGDNPRLEKASFALLQSFSRSKRHRDAMMNNNEFTATLAAAIRSSSTTIDFKRDALELFSSFTIHYFEPKEDLITLFCDVIESQTRTLQLSRDRQEQSSSKQLIGVVISGLQNLLCNGHDQTRSLRAASDLFIFLCNTLFSGPRSRRTSALTTDGTLFATLTSLLLLSFGSEDIRKSIFTTQLISSLIRFIMMTSRVETVDCHVAFYNKDGEEYWEAANAQCLQILTYIVNMTTQVHLDTTFACLIGESEPSINSFSMCLQSISNRAHGGSPQVWARQLLANLERLS